MYNKLFIIKITCGNYDITNKNICLNWNNIIEEHEFSVPQTNTENLLYRSILREFIKIYDKFIYGSKCQIKKLNLEFKIKNITFINDKIIFNIAELDTSCFHYSSNDISLDNEVLHLYIDSININKCYNNKIYESVNYLHDEQDKSNLNIYSGQHVNDYLYHNTPHYHNQHKPYHHKLHGDEYNNSYHKPCYHKLHDNEHNNSYHKPCYHKLYDDEHNNYHYKPCYSKSHHDDEHNISHHKPCYHKLHDDDDEHKSYYKNIQHNNYNKHYDSDQNHNHNHDSRICHDWDYDYECDRKKKSSTKNVKYYNSIHDIYKCNSIDKTDKLHDSKKKKLNVGIFIPLSGLLYNEGRAANNTLKYLKNELISMNDEIEFIFSMNDLKSDEYLLKKIKELHRNENIEIFICGPMDNNKMKIIEVYVKSNNLLLLTFGYSLKNNFISENIISLSPVLDVQARAASAYIENNNKSLKKHIIPCYINNIYGNYLFNSVTNRLKDINNIGIDSAVTYELSSIDLNKMYNKIKNKIDNLLNADVSSKQIYLYFISYYEIINFVAYVLENDEDKIFEKINWVGTDSNHIIFNKYLKEYYYETFNVNSSDVSFKKVMEFFVKVKFICFTHHYDEHVKNNIIIETTGTNPFGLEMFDCFWLLANSFIITNSNNKNKLRNTIKAISKNQKGLTGNLSLDNNGCRIYSKYAIRRANLINDIFKWKKIGTYDIHSGLVID